MKFIFERIPRFLLGLFLFSAVAINVANVIARYVFHAPLIWAEEIMTFIMVWSVFTGIILVSGQQAHLKMDLVATIFPKSVSRKMSIFIELVTVIICAVMVLASSEVLRALGGYHQLSIVAEIPMVIPHFAIPFGFFCIGCIHLANLVNKLRKRS